jgi:hypothetical protein
MAANRTSLEAIALRHSDGAHSTRFSNDFFGQWCYIKIYVEHEMERLPPVVLVSADSRPIFVFQSGGKPTGGSGIESSTNEAECCKASSS